MIWIQYVLRGITDLIEVRPICLTDVLSRCLSSLAWKTIEVKALLRRAFEMVLLRPHVVARAAAWSSLTCWRDLVQCFVGVELWNMKVTAVTA